MVSRVVAGVLLLGATYGLQRAGAQVVQGHLLEVRTGRPVVLAMVALTDTAYQIVDETLTDHEGAFTLLAPEPGDHFVVANRIGYRPAIDGILELGEGGYIEVTFYITPRPVELEGITASVERIRTERLLDLAGFYDRRESGLGHFIGPEELERRQPMDTQELLRRIPGINVVSNGFAGESVRCAATRSGIPDVYIDGVRAAPDVDLDGIIGIENMAGVEVYSRPLQVPLQYGGTNGGCVILVWTIH